MMTNPMIALIERRASANRFDPAHTLSEAQIEDLTRLATRAPTAYHLQNWRFIAVRTPETKARLRVLAHGQAKVKDAAATFIVCGVLPDHAAVPERLQPFLKTGLMPADTVSAWREGARLQYADPRTARDEAIRSAALGASTLMFAAEAMGLASGPMAGFDAEAVARAFALRPDEIPAMLVAVGRAAPRNWPQKPRRPLAEILDIA